MNTLTEYIEAGFFALPAIPGRKQPYFSYADRMRQGWKPTVEDALKWEKQYTDSDILIRTGQPSKMWTLDLDKKIGADGVEAFEKKVKGDRELPDTPMVRSQSGGGHIHFLWEDRYKRFKSVTDVGFPGIDIRVNGGIIIMPTTTNNYTWFEGKSFGECKLAKAPDWLFDWLCKNTKDAIKNSSYVNLDGKPLEKIQRGAGVDEYIYKMFNRMRRHEGFHTAMMEDIGNAFQKHYVEGDQYPASKINALARDTAKKISVSTRYEYDLADSGYVSEYFKMFPDDLRYSPSMGWYIWNGVYWRLMKDSDSEVSFRLKKLRTKLLAETQYAPRDVQEWVRRFGDKTKTDAAIKILKTDNRVEIIEPHKFFDQDDMLLNCQNGVVDLKTGQLLDVDDRRKLYMSRYVPINYNPNVAQDLKDIWQNHLDVITTANTNGRRERADRWQDFVQLCYGYSITGNNDEQVFFELKGRGSSGKSATTETTKNCFGTYAGAIGIKHLLSDSGIAGGHSDSLVSLIGQRVTYTAEPPANRPVNESFIKSVTGQNTQEGSAKYKSSINFELKTKFIVETNHGLKFNDNGTDSFERRLIRVAFDAKIPAEQRNTNILKDLKIAQEATLLWMVEGAVRWWNELKINGKALLTVAPSEFILASKQATQTQDKLSGFFNDYFKWDDGYIIHKDEFYYLYRNWCLEHGYKSESSGGLDCLISDREEGARILKGVCTNGTQFKKNNIYYRGLRPKNDAIDLFKAVIKKRLDEDGWGPLLLVEYSKYHGENDLPKGQPLNSYVVD